MHPLEKKIHALLRNEGLIRQGERIVVGVSGGPDSIALLHVLAALRSLMALELHAVYVDHGLRPHEVAAERSLVASRARSLGVEYDILHIDVQGESSAGKISIEHAARDLRYEALHQAARSRQAGKIAVAHTADDQAEEVLLRLVRGTARAGLSGMRSLRDNIIVRPFLTTAKKDLLAYLAEKKITYATDSSNASRVYLRNRVRLDLLPYLRTFNPNIDETLRRTAMILQDEETVLIRLTEEVWEEVVVLEPDGKKRPALALALKPFLSLDKAIQRRIAEKIFITLENSPDFKKIDQILFVAQAGETGARLHFSRGLRMKKERERLFFSYPQGRGAHRGDLDAEMDEGGI
ncbi:MAG: tRNA lysidine(34) synthetase TilS [Pseudomonadota bacterium]